MLSNVMVLSGAANSPASKEMRFHLMISSLLKFKSASPDYLLKQEWSHDSRNTGSADFGGLLSMLFGGGLVYNLRHPPLERHGLMT
jgi:hypothetical protein